MSKFCFLIYALLFFYVFYNKYIIFIVRKKPINIIKKQTNNQTLPSEKKLITHFFSTRLKIHSSQEGELYFRGK